jgi:hypothetical protein
MVITLGKQILGIPESKELRADYIDGDNLNCQKSNLRIASVTQINYTKASLVGTTSKYKGVSKKIDVRRSHIWWLASIKPTKDGKLLEKTFPFTPEGEILAGKQYDEWAKKYQGDFAVLNFPDDKYAKGGLIAPNGKPSNLTPEQYKLVRTTAFKNWFGDWETSLKMQVRSLILTENHWWLGILAKVKSGTLFLKKKPRKTNGLLAKLEYISHRLMQKN